MDSLKQMPQSIEAEQVVLGCILNNAHSIEDIIGILVPEDFYHKHNAIIYECMVTMFSKSINIDVVTTAEELRKMNMLSEVGGVTYLSRLLDGSGISRNIKNYVEIIKEKSKKRLIIATAKDMITKAYDDAADPKDILENAEDSIFIITENKESRMQSIDNCLDKALKNIEQIYFNGGGLIGLATEFSSLDKQLNGLQRGDFIIVAARPSMGKTAFALNIAANVGKKNKTAIFSLEMSEEQLTQRLLSSMSVIELQKLRAGRLDENEWAKLAQYSSILSNRKIMIDDTPGTTVNEIKAKCKKLKIKNGLDVVIIDYLQLIEGSGQSREQEVSKISRSLKKLAKELDLTVIALSQLSRAPEQRVDHRPQLSDLRESGSIEQDADTVVFLYRDEYYNAESDEKNIAECIIAKNRNGQVGTIKLAWLGQYQRFGNLETIRR